MNDKKIEERVIRMRNQIQILAMAITELSVQLNELNLVLESKLSDKKEKKQK